MITRLKHIISSIRTTITLCLLLSVIFGVATFVENSHGTTTVAKWFYKNPILFIIEFITCLNFIAISIKYKLIAQKKWGVLMLHYGFVVILVGAMTTYLFGEEGLIHIREGQTSNVIIDNYGKPIDTLPFDITLKDFKLQRYSGLGSPSSYESFLVIDGEKYHAYMNNVVYVGEYRLYQSSYDKDLGGTILSVNRDLWGTIITYLGYFLLIIGIPLSFMHKNSRFRRISRTLSVVVLFISIGSSSALAQQHSHLQIHSGKQNLSNQQSLEQQQPLLDRTQEKLSALDFVKTYSINDSVVTRFSALLVQSPMGRIEPVDTYAREILRKISRSTSFEHKDASEVLMGIISQPQIWSRIEFVKVSNDSLIKQIMQVSDAKDHIAFIDIIDDNGDYILANEIEVVLSKNVKERNKYDKELVKLDEKINILNALFEGRYFALLPLDDSANDQWFSSGDNLSSFEGQDSLFVSHIMPWYYGEIQQSIISNDWSEPARISDMIALYQSKKSNVNLYSKNKIEAEILYNKLELFKWCGFGYMGLSMIMILFIIVSMINNKRYKTLIYTLIIAIGVLFLLQNLGMAMRWYISGRAPWTNSYETMIYVGWAAMLGGYVFIRKSQMAYALAVFLAGVLLFVSNLSYMDPQITPLVPVLKSYWLIIHVAVITASYGLFGICFLLGLATMIMMMINPSKLCSNIKELTVINELSMWLGLCFMTAGTFLGAIWANESWGRYWGWDPKETWALITILIYAMVLHMRFNPRLRGEYIFSVTSVLALSVVLMTFFGVNYYLTGLHSYGGDSAPIALNAIWIIYGVVLIIIAISGIRYFKSRPIKPKMPPIKLNG